MSSFFNAIPTIFHWLSSLILSLLYNPQKNYFPFGFFNIAVENPTTFNTRDPTENKPLFSWLWGQKKKKKKFTLPKVKFNWVSTQKKA